MTHVGRREETLVGRGLSPALGLATGNGVPVSTRLRRGSLLHNSQRRASPRLLVRWTPALGFATGNGVPASTRPQSGSLLHHASRRGVSPRLLVGWRATTSSSPPRRSPPQPSGSPGMPHAPHRTVECVFRLLIPCRGPCIVSLKVLVVAAQNVKPRTSSLPQAVPRLLTFASLGMIMTPFSPARMVNTMVVSICLVVGRLDGHDTYPSVAVHFLLMSYAVFYLAWGQVP